MVTISMLWLPILLSAIFVWIASAIVWMALPHHKSDYKGLPDEETARQALLPQNLSPGQYNIPHLYSREDIKKPKVKKKFEDGPAGFITIVPKGIPRMGKGLGLTFIFYLIIGIFIAYLTSRTLTSGAPYLAVFRISGAVAWLAYGTGVVQDAIWFGRPWSSVFKHLFDALIYALLTAGTFGWLWPDA